MSHLNFENDLKPLLLTFKRLKWITPNECIKFIQSLSGSYKMPIPAVPKY